MRILFDTDVILDVLLARPPHAIASSQLLNLADQEKIEGLVCATTVTTVYYLASKSVGRRRALKAIRELLGIFDVAMVDKPVLDSALRSAINDFEDAVVHESARSAGATGIVTRNIKDFRRATLTIFSPQELLNAAASLDS